MHALPQLCPGFVIAAVVKPYLYDGVTPEKSESFAAMLAVAALPEQAADVPPLAAAYPAGYPARLLAVVAVAELPEQLAAVVALAIVPELIRYPAPFDN